MKYRKTKRALLKLLEHDYDKWNEIKSKKVIIAAMDMKGDVAGFLNSIDRKSGKVYVLLKMPEMLIKQN